jgi:hypothetical protein
MTGDNSNTNDRTLKALLIIHGLITLAATVVLIIAPNVIPGTVDIDISSKEYLLCYFLGAAELCIAFLSFFASKIEDKKALRLISSTFIVFHLATGTLETFALSQGTSSKILFNILLRIIITALFWYYGIHKTKT